MQTRRDPSKAYLISTYLHYEDPCSMASFSAIVKCQIMPTKILFVMKCEGSGFSRERTTIIFELRFNSLSRTDSQYAANRVHCVREYVWAAALAISVQRWG